MFVYVYIIECKYVYVCLVIWTVLSIKKVLNDNEGCKQNDLLYPTREVFIFIKIIIIMKLVYCSTL